mmetsp:Transcript_22951/g.52685  ORF Transcript_22951/g.52685 Transcript_22951/m.52685 type:complete len:111 (-) Transcript_22951:86-418(-)
MQLQIHLQTNCSDNYSVQNASLMQPQIHLHTNSLPQNPDNERLTLTIIINQAVSPPLVRDARNRRHNRVSTAAHPLIIADESLPHTRERINDVVKNRLLVDDIVVVPLEV